MGAAGAIGGCRRGFDTKELAGAGLQLTGAAELALGPYRNTGADGIFVDIEALLVGAAALFVAVAVCGADP